MKTLTLVAVMMTAGLAATPALADHDRRASGRHTEYAKVVSSTPIYRRVRITEPRRECWEERVVRPVQHGFGPTASAITGAIIGGVIGHQFGSGRGNDAATAAGVIIGAGVGEQAGRENHRYTERVSYETQCRTLHDVHYERVVEGYDVTYRYHGRLYHTRTARDPGRRIPVRVDVAPAGY